MNKRLWLIASMAIFIVGCRASMAQDVSDPNRMLVTLSNPGSAATLDVRVNQGEISVVGSERSDVEITASDDVFRPDPAAEGLRRLTMARLTVTEENNVVTVRGTAGDPDLDIDVPVRTDLRLRSNNDGIEVEGVQGDIEATSQNDDVTLRDVAGSVVAHSQNDDVRVVMTRVTPDTLMAFTSVNGDVDVTLPANVRANVQMSTVNGDIFTDFEIEIGASSTSESETNFRFRRNRTLRGTLNGGGPEFEFRTVNGNVYIRRGQ